MVDTAIMPKTGFQNAFIALALLLAGTTLPVQAQQSTSSREVVQALPSPDVARLNGALRRLASNSRDLGALIDAGNAALALGDLDAAMGFFGRAQELSPTSGSVKMGMAAVLLRSDRPVDALRLFAEAEQAGASVDAVLPERGLAYDLVGNNQEAQVSYRAALARGGNPEVSRRLALSQAIAGDREGFESSLRPLLLQRDYAAYRTRAFGLAILGDAKEARDIADAVMPRDLSSRIAPYLDYMPRLTKAQQAAAANLGIFPNAAQIGRDDPRIAQYANSASSAARNAGAKLAPAGAPLGSEAARPDADSSKRRKIPGAAERSGSRLASVARDQTTTPPVAAPPVSTPPAAAPRAAPPPPVADPIVASPVVEEPVVKEAAAKEVVATPSISTFDLAATAQAQSPPRPQALPPAAEPAPSVADAFGDLAASNVTPPGGATGAVDITAIDVKREKPPEPPKPKAPVHPSRAWVQVATGKDLGALKFDWRRISRKAPDLLGSFKPYVTPWGQANRLLAGPVASPEKAREMVKALKEQGLDSFTYTSPEGEEITLLQ
ncbi:SPOR domain-containing protein [Altererythrobacter arenosus]|uniref:SPOR domain-containing protein n=1 Tax=Altererythrobacter arenosus TaxID=3032592 RepID=A0ABY8FSJ1_9SPHN|nr:SPOR domain-containing protein [Altererythrobacter sp. CAU 1644]WFL77983.1 SPOR domain-containing protein [Altererythrobacter sp. CAU 1644]